MLSAIQIRDVLREAVRATDPNWTKFCRDTGLPIDRSNLRKKLTGENGISLHDAVIIARALGWEVALLKRGRRVAP